MSGERAARLFQENYLSVPQHGARAITFPHRFVAPSNTGIASGKDLDNDGQVVTTPGTGAYGNDSFGFGEFPGKFGLAVFSRLPIDYRKARTFQLFKWKDMPGALLPDNPATVAPHDWYSPDELDIFRLSSKSHWDIPIRISGRTLRQDVARAGIVRVTGAPRAGRVRAVAWDAAGNASLPAMRR